MNEELHFDRVCRVTAWGTKPGVYFVEQGDGVILEGMRVQFKIEKTLKAEPNKCEITITNLAERTRAALGLSAMRVRLEAGYSETGLRLLFVGDVKPGSGSKIVGPAWETKLLLGDGIRSFANARVSRSYKPGTPTLTILRDVASSLQLAFPPEIAADPKLLAQLSTGEVITGFASDELSRLLGPYGYTWSIQNSQLVIVSDEGTRPGQEREISQETGLVGSPEFEHPGKPSKKGKSKKPLRVKAKTLLYPELIPGGKVRLRSQALDGLYGKIFTVTHEGDTHGNAWYTETEVVP